MSASFKKSEKHNNCNTVGEEQVIMKHWLVDIILLEEVGLYETLEGILRQHYISPTTGKVYTYDDWEYLMYTDHNVFPDLCYEFHSTFNIKEKPKSIKDKDFMRFRLDGKPRNMSLDDFTRCLKIYSREEEMDYFDNDEVLGYIWLGDMVSDINNNKVFDPKTVWKKFSSKTSWVEGKVSRMDIDDVNYRLIHMFLSLNIFHRSDDTDKVTLSDLWHLEKIRSENHVNIPYSVAYYLKHFAVVREGGKEEGQKRRITICGGHFVTLIAQHFGVIDDKSGEPLQPLPYLRENPMISLQQFLDENVPGITNFILEDEDDEPIDTKYEYEQKKNNNEGVYERIMAMLEDDQHQLSKSQLTEIQKKIESQLKIDTNNI